MKVKLSNYVAQFLVDHGIDTVFTVTGGGAMHLNDGFGKQKGLHCVYQHHEQACAIAGEAYARIHNKIGAVCVTTGPGGTNAITGVVGGWLDSIPMLVISGQVRYDTTARSTGLGIRAMGDQEFDICKAVESMTKYCEMVIDPLKIRYCLEKALFLALNGRQGPCWLDIPVNIQGSYIDTDELVGFDPKKEFKENGRRWQEEVVPAKPSEETIEAILEKVKAAKRPVINAGSAIRYSGGFQDFEELVNRLNIPVVTGWNSIDVIPDEDERYTGRAGIMGDRAGNFAIQNSDLVLSLGSRLSIRQVGYNFKTWAREAYTIVVDVDPEELKKPTIHVSMPVCADVKDVMQMMNQKLSEQGYGEDRSNMFVNMDAETVEEREAWLSICQNWKEKYPVVQPKHYESQKYANVYAFVKTLSDALPEDYITVVGNGSACVVGSHAYTIKKGQRFIINSAIASMGYDLPAAIGACVADGAKELVCLTGDGSIQMNLQELQTIKTNKLPIKIFIINNQGYHSIRQTQTNFFGEPLVGIGPESHDLEFPSMEKLAYAYDYPYFSCDSNENLEETVHKALEMEGSCICEVFVTTEQKFEPKSATKRLEDGTLVSPPLEDLAPFLPREEFLSNMLIKPIEE
jgi:acetolactate synthase I/II/III large subunit